MGNYADYSDLIAQINVWRSALEFIAFDGKWSKSPLLSQWGQISYGLSLEQLAALEQQLEDDYAEAYQQYLQQKLAGHRKDKTRIQLELPLYKEI